MLLTTTAQKKKTLNNFLLFALIKLSQTEKCQSLHTLVSTSAGYLWKPKTKISKFSTSWQEFFACLTHQDTWPALMMVIPYWTQVTLCNFWLWVTHTALIKIRYASLVTTCWFGTSQIRFSWSIWITSSLPQWPSLAIRTSLLRWITLWPPDSSPHSRKRKRRNSLSLMSRDWVTSSYKHRSKWSMQMIIESE